MANGWYWSALVVFVVAALTDALDGYFARLLDQGTAIGRQLDPLVDKVIVCGAFIYLLTVPGDTGLAPWMVTTIVVRELLIQGLRSHLEGGGQAFGAKTAGKLKTLVQCLSISAILVVLGLQPSPGLAARPRRPDLVGRRPDRSTAAWATSPWPCPGSGARSPPPSPDPPDRRDLMDWIESLALGVVQGLTEFLPISSDGHLNITQIGFNALTGKTRSIGGGDLLRRDAPRRDPAGDRPPLPAPGRSTGPRGCSADRPTSRRPYRRPAVIRTGAPRRRRDPAADPRQAVLHEATSRRPSRA